MLLPIRLTSSTCYKMIDSNGRDLYPEPFAQISFELRIYRRWPGVRRATFVTYLGWTLASHVELSVMSLTFLEEETHRKETLILSL